jgi:ribonucleotide monophosphatase NagD (HAD superfamily)
VEVETDEDEASSKNSALRTSHSLAAQTPHTAATSHQRTTRRSRQARVRKGGVDVRGEEDRPTLDVVVCQRDLEVVHVEVLKIALAYHYIKRGAVFLATNIDSTLPNSGTLFPTPTSGSIMDSSPAAIFL